MDDDTKRRLFTGLSKPISSWSDSDYLLNNSIDRSKWLAIRIISRQSKDKIDKPLNLN